MKLTKTSLLALLVLSALVLLVLPIGGPEGAEASPGRRKSGGGWGGLKTKAKGIFTGNRRKNNNNYGNNHGNNYGNNYGSSSSNFGGSGYKKKGGTMKTLKKAAVIGAVAYGSYKVGQLSSRFSGGYHGMGMGGYGFNDWNKWREADGFMCRNNDDCNWIDRRLFCQDYEMDFQPSVSTIIDNSSNMILG